MMEIGKPKLTEIAGAVGRILVLHVFGRDSARVIRGIRAVRPEGALQQVGEIFAVMYPSAKVELSHGAVWQYTTDVADAFVLKMKRFVVFMIKNKHAILLQKENSRLQNKGDNQLYCTCFPFWQRE